MHSIVSISMIGESLKNSLNIKTIMFGGTGVCDIVFPYNEDKLLKYFANEINGEFGESITWNDMWGTKQTPYFVVFIRHFMQRKITACLGIIDPNVKMIDYIEVKVPLWCCKKTLKNIAYYLKHNIVYLITNAELSTFV